MKTKHNLPPWLKPKAASSNLAVGVGWYTEENWAKVKAAASDPDRFEETYQEWTDMAEKALHEIRTAGVKAEKFNINSDALLAWCFSHGKANNAASRAEFISQMGSQNRASAA